MIALAACGDGGGSGGSSTPMPSYTLSQTSVSAQATSGDSSAQTIVINYTLTNVASFIASGFLVSEVVPSGTAVENVETSVTDQSADQNTVNGTITLTLWPGSVLGAGTFTGTIQYSLCHNAHSNVGCETTIAGTPANIAVTLTITGSARPTTTAMLSINALSLEAPSSAASGPSTGAPTLTLTAGSPPLSVTFSQPAGGFVSGVTYSPVDSENGNLMITYAVPSTLSLGMHSESLTINVCIDPECDHPLANSPIIIPVSYDVTASAGSDYNAQSVPIMANDIAWSGAQGKIYAVVAQGSPTDPETLAEIDPNAGTITRTLALPGNPRVLAVSEDGTYAFIGFSDKNIVERVAIATFVSDIEIVLGGDDTTGPINAGYLAAIPSEPHSIVVSTYANAPGLSSDNSEGVFVFDDLAVRGAPFGTRTAGPVLNSIVFGAGNSTLYAVEPNFENLSTLSLATSGLSVVQTVGLGQIAFGGYLVFANGLLYDSDTRELDPSSGTVQGRFLPQGAFSSAAIAADPTLNRAYVFFQDQTTAAPEWTLETFDLQRMTAVALARTSGIVGPEQSYTLFNERVIRWGISGLAINGEMGLEIISGAFVTQ